MIRYKQLVTLNVLDKETKKPIGKIFDVAYSNDFKKVDYLIIKNNNLIKNKIPISYKYINFLDSNEPLYIGDINEFQDRIDEEIKVKFRLVDKQIRVENGECIGYIKDVVINKDDGSIDGFIITEGLFEDLLKGRNYVPLLKNIRIEEDHIYIPYKYIM